jgi:hypothetical protein
MNRTSNTVYLVDESETFEAIDDMIESILATIGAL